MNIDQRLDTYPENALLLGDETMTTILIRVNIDNDAFVDRTAEEIEFVLRQVTTGETGSRLADGERVKLRDSNGNTVGCAGVQSAN